MTLKPILISALMLLTMSCSGKASSTGADSAATVGETVAKAVPADSADMPVVMDFTATWCGPCRAIAPYVHELADKVKDRVTFRYVDIDQNQDLAMKYGIEAVPTFIILDAEGNETERIVGADIDGLTRAVDKITKK